MLACRSYLRTFLKESVKKCNGLTLRNERHIHKCSLLYCKDKKDKKDNILAGSIASKYEIFVDEKSPIIFDVEQERDKFYEVNDESERQEKIRKSFYGISPTEGKSGVFEIEELVAILQRENAINIVVLKIPEQYAYVDYFLITSGKSYKHMSGMAEYIMKVYKYKTKQKSYVPSIGGKESNIWKAIDLGNIILHIFSESGREIYDIESLWSVGSQYDTKCRNLGNENDDNYASILANLMPAS